ncbi:MAG TPA: cytochrome c [Gemmatimonadaceae bacterium]|nr:cytochrome c [Gemmatimonadaceae bacterium]
MNFVFRALRAIVVTVVVACLGLAIWVYIVSERRLNKIHDMTVTPVAARTDSASITRGEYLFQSISCTLCHGEDGGGAVLQRDRFLGTIAGPNLTRGRGGSGWQRSDIDWVRAIRRGVRPDGTSLIVMPSEVFTHMAESDVGALLGYMRQLPPVDRFVPASRFGPLGRALLAAGKLNILVAPKTPRYEAPAIPPRSGTIEYGRYLADVSGCHGCHGYGLSGGRVAGPPGLPPASNLTPTGIGTWTEADFRRAMREGKRPDGSAIDPFMPWEVFRKMSDADLHTLWLYLQSVPSKEFGNK